MQHPSLESYCLQYLGLWQTFGDANLFETGRAVVRRDFDRGVAHFDLANNYGLSHGSAEENFGEVLERIFSATGMNS
jgi:L-glyceraldehyde 3-phosphate reductase